MKTKSRRAHSFPKPNRPGVICRSSTRAELLELTLRSGLGVFTTMLKEDRIAICGPRNAHEPDRPASGAVTTPSEVVLGGRKVTIQRPRVRRRPARSRCRCFRRWRPPIHSIGASSNRFWLGVATRQYARSLEPLGPEMNRRGTSKSAVQPLLRGSHNGAVRRLAERAARHARPGPVADRWRAPRRSRPHRRVGDRRDRQLGLLVNQEERQIA